MKKQEKWYGLDIEVQYGTLGEMLENAKGCKRSWFDHESQRYDIIIGGTLNETLCKEYGREQPKRLYGVMLYIDRTSGDSIKDDNVEGAVQATFYNDGSASSNGRNLVESRVYPIKANIIK